VAVKAACRRRITALDTGGICYRWLRRRHSVVIPAAEAGVHAMAGAGELNRSAAAPVYVTGVSCPEVDHDRAPGVTSRTEGRPRPRRSRPVAPPSITAAPAATAARQPTSEESPARRDRPATSARTSSCHKPYRQKADRQPREQGK